MNSLIQFRIAENIKKDASEIYENLGLDLTSAIKLFLNKTIKLKKLPFSVSAVDNDLEDQIRMNKELALKELDLLDLNISSSINEKDEIYNAIMDKYESIN